MTRAALTLLAALLLGSAAAQSSTPPGCEARDVQLELANVGVAQAGALDTDGDTTILTDACLTQGGLTIEADTLQTTGDTTTARTLRVRGAALDGTATRLVSDPGGVRLEGLRARLTLPNAALPGLPIAPGVYDLVGADIGLVNGTFQTSDLTLTAADGQVTRFTNAAINERGVRAGTLQLGRVQASGVQVAPDLVIASRARVNLCRDPRATGLVLDARGVASTPDGTRLQRGTLEAGPLRLPVVRRLAIRARGATVGETIQTLQSDADSLITGVQSSPPQLIASSSSFGLRNVPLLDAGDTRVSVVHHATFPEVNFTRRAFGAVIRAGVFEKDGAPMPEFSAARQVDRGFTGLLAVRADPYLSEARAGYTTTLQGVRLLAESGAGRQAEVVRNAAGQDVQVPVNVGFVHAQVSAGRDVTLAPGMSVGATLIGDTLLFTDRARPIQAYVEGQARAGAHSGPFSITFGHTARVVTGVSPLPALRVTNQQTSVMDARYAPAATNAVRLDAVSAHAKYNWLTSTWEAASATISGRVESQAGLIAPRVTYDLVARAATLGTDLLAYTDCFAYGLALDYTFPNTPAPGQAQQGASFKAGVRFSFR